MTFGWYSLDTDAGTPAVCERCGRAVLDWTNPHTGSRIPLDRLSAKPDPHRAGRRLLRVHEQTCPFAGSWNEPRRSPHP